MLSSTSIFSIIIDFRNNIPPLPLSLPSSQSFRSLTRCSQKLFLLFLNSPSFSCLSRLFTIFHSYSSFFFCPSPLSPLLEHFLPLLSPNCPWFCSVCSQVLGLGFHICLSQWGKDLQYISPFWLRSPYTRGPDPLLFFLPILRLLPGIQDQSYFPLGKRFPHRSYFMCIVWASLQLHLEKHG